VACARRVVADGVAVQQEIGRKKKEKGKKYEGKKKEGR